MNEEVDAAARTFGLKEGEGNARWWGGGLATIKATGKETDGLYSIVEVLEPQGAQAPLHLHRKEDEAFAAHPFPRGYVAAATLLVRRG
jgi:hypothetical protein